MAAYASAAAITSRSTPFGAGRPVDSNHLHQHDFDHLPDARDRRAILDLAHELETALEIELPETSLRDVRTREDLIDVILGEIAAKAPAETDPDEDESSTLRVRISSKRAPAGWYVERSVPWTPYSLETIWDDAVHAGSGSVVDVRAPHGTPRGCIVRLEQRFAPLRYRGIRVRVRVDAPVQS